MARPINLSIAIAIGVLCIASVTSASSGDESSTTQGITDSLLPYDVTLSPQDETTLSRDTSLSPKDKTVSPDDISLPPGDLNTSSEEVTVSSREVTFSPTNLTFFPGIDNLFFGSNNVSVERPQLSPESMLLSPGSIKYSGGNTKPTPGSEPVVPGSMKLSAATKDYVWPSKYSAEIPGDVVLGGLMMIHSRSESSVCGPIMAQGGIQALETMLYTIDRINSEQTMNLTLGVHVLDDCDQDTHGLEMAVDFIKGKKHFSVKCLFTYLQFLYLWL